MAYCEQCGTELKKGDAITIKNGLTAYHEYCYLKDLNKDKYEHKSKRKIRQSE